MDRTEQETKGVLNRLAKWRAVLAGWQLGTRPKGDPEGDAVRDHREVTLLMRAELNAFTQLLINKGILDKQEFLNQLYTEAILLELAYQQKFPGAKATDIGMEFDDRIKKTMEGWKP
jgi:hypothetical protein